MGVQGLWKLLSASGSRVSLDTLATRKLAVDVSIWLVQFIKAMRDKQGNATPNAHLLGLFRRICKLLYHHIKPVFVFDGPAPALKKRTLAQRQRVREQSKTNLKRTAERILLNQLKLKGIDMARPKGRMTIAPPPPSRRHSAAAAAKTATVVVEPNEEEKADAAAAATAQAIANAIEGTGGDGDGGDAPLESIHEGTGASGDDDDVTSIHPPANKKRRIAAAAVDPDDDDDGEGEGEGEDSAHGGDDAKQADTNADAVNARHARKQAGAAWRRRRFNWRRMGLASNDTEFTSLLRIVSAGGAVDPAIVAALPMSQQMEVMAEARVARRVSSMSSYNDTARSAPDEFSTLQLDNFIKSTNFNRTVNQIREDGAAQFQTVSTAAPAFGGGGFIKSDIKRGTAAASSSSSAAAAAAAPVTPIAGAGVGASGTNTRARPIASETGKRYVLFHRSPRDVAAAAAAAASATADSAVTRIKSEGGGSTRVKLESSLKSTTNSAASLFSASAATPIDVEATVRDGDDATGDGGGFMTDEPDSTPIEIAEPVISFDSPALALKAKAAAAAVEAKKASDASNRVINQLMRDSDLPFGNPIVTTAARETPKPPAAPASASSSSTLDHKHSHAHASPARQSNQPQQHSSPLRPPATASGDVLSSPSKPVRLPDGSVAAFPVLPPESLASEEGAAAFQSWSCHVCTYINAPHARSCGVCHVRRGLAIDERQSGPGDEEYDALQRTASDANGTGAGALDFFQPVSSFALMTKPIGPQSFLPSPAPTTSTATATPTPTATTASSATPATPAKPATATAAATATATATPSPPPSAASTSAVVATPMAALPVAPSTGTVSVSPGTSLMSWRCDKCTFFNPSNAAVCNMCRTPKHAEVWSCPNCAYLNIHTTTNGSPPAAATAAAAGTASTSSAATASAVAVCKICRHPKDLLKPAASVGLAPSSLSALAAETRASPPPPPAASSGVNPSVVRALSTSIPTRTAAAAASTATAAPAPTTLTIPAAARVVASPAVAILPAVVTVAGTKPTATAAAPVAVASASKSSAAAAITIDDDDDEPVITATKKSAAAAVEEEDPLFPSAIFQPKVKLQAASPPPPPPRTLIAASAKPPAAPVPAVPARVPPPTATAAAATTTNVQPISAPKAAAPAAAPSRQVVDLDDTASGGESEDAVVVMDDQFLEANDSPAASRASAKPVSSAMEAVSKSATQPLAAAVISVDALRRLHPSAEVLRPSALDFTDARVGPDRSAVPAKTSEERAMDELARSVPPVRPVNQPPKPVAAAVVTSVPAKAVAVSAAAAAPTATTTTTTTTPALAIAPAVAVPAPVAPIPAPAPAPAAASLGAGLSILSDAEHAKQIELPNFFRMQMEADEKKKKAAAEQQAKPSAPASSSSSSAAAAASAGAANDYESGDRIVPSSSHPNDEVVMAYEPAPFFDPRLMSASASTEAEIVALQQSKRSQQATSEHVTPEMIDDAQQLLRLFGCPFVVSPAEAEAQCAVLAHLGLVDGVVTDDSDVFLFAQQLTVYRNMFEDKKYVERYTTAAIESDLGLDRSKLVSLAMLLGSDYTIGVTGIGIVNAMEIVNAFAPPPPADGTSDEKDDRTDNGLAEFRKWCYSGSAERKPAPPDTSEEWFTLSSSERAERLRQYRLALFKYRHRHARTKWAVSSHFPDQSVMRAYWHPSADHSTEPVKWSPPDADGLAVFCMTKFGWSEQQTAQTLEPVLAACAQTNAQAKLDAFFTADDRFAAIKSKRLAAAVSGLTKKKPRTADAISAAEAAAVAASDDEPPASAAASDDSVANSIPPPAASSSTPAASAAIKRKRTNSSGRRRS